MSIHLFQAALGVSVDIVVSTIQLGRPQGLPRAEVKVCQWQLHCAWIGIGNRLGHAASQLMTKHWTTQAVHTYYCTNRDLSKTLRSSYKRVELISKPRLKRRNPWAGPTCVLLAAGWLCFLIRHRPIRTSDPQIRSASRPILID